MSETNNLDVQDEAQIAKEFGNAVLQAKLSADKIVGLTSSVEKVPLASHLLLTYRNSSGTALFSFQLAENGRVTSSALVKGFHPKVARHVTTACESMWSADGARSIAAGPAAKQSDAAPSTEIIAEWVRILKSPAPAELLDQLRSITAEYKELHGEADSEPDEDGSPCLDIDWGWESDTVQEEWYSDSEDAIAKWMSRGGYDIRDTDLDDRFVEWSNAVIGQVNAAMTVDDAQLSHHAYDQNEAVFHEMESDLRANPPDGLFLAEWFSKKLDSALAAIPEPLRNFLDALTDAYKLDDFDSVIEFAEEEGMCGDERSDEDEDGEEADRFTEVEIERAWEFIKNYRYSIDLLDATNEAAGALLNPATSEVQKYK